MSGEIETNDECFFDGVLSCFMDKKLVKRIRDKESPSFFSNQVLKGFFTE